MSEVQAATTPDPKPLSDTETLARLQAYAQAVKLDPEGTLKPDQMFVPTMENAIALIKRQPTQAPWRRTYSGSGDNQGWSIYAGDQLVAYLGGDDTFGEAVDKLVYAHNKVLGYVL